MPQPKLLSPLFDEEPMSPETELLRARISRLIDHLAAAEHRLRMEAGEANRSPGAVHRAREFRTLHGRVNSCLEYCLTGLEKRCAQWYAERFRRHLENRPLSKPPVLA